ncbi:hypothetical protein [Arenibacter certesii]|uniref:Uncharacterized protein n=1 Tax=Arenibacter certesii TaxID=228955 RepID=A0A918MQY7_9FLAO|nr:hypothetical protein [Arenibacter certesii]GGW45526.1 hypothetical protein GCM10007383_32400 [Arenibacter certesii]
MKKSLLIIILLSIEFITAQSVAKVEKYPLKAMDLVLFSFGVEHPITIGSIADSGEIHFNLPKDLTSINDEVKANFMSDAIFTLFSKCDNNYDRLSEDENIEAVNGGFISLSTQGNPYSGLLYMITDDALLPWLEDSYSNNAVIGSYYEVVYVASDFNYQGQCNATISNTENDTIETLYTYDINLKVGFNFIEYKIESVVEHQIPSMYEEDVYDKIAKPSKITVTSSTTTPQNTKWIGKYF